MDIRENELSTVGVTDPAEIARIREERFLLRQARILADTHLGAALQAWFLDREIWNGKRAAAEFGWKSESNVWDLRRVTEEFGPQHSGAYPDLDNEAGTAEAGVEAGRLREWAEQRGSHTVDPATGKLIKRPAMRHGRKRADRGNLNKRSHVLGTPRKGKKGTPAGPRRKYSAGDVDRIRGFAAEGLNDETIAARLGEPFTAKIVERLRWTNRIPAGSIQLKQQRDTQQ